MTAPLLVFAIGNDSRGDDALGPLLLRGLQAEGNTQAELIEDYQLQVEHVTDLHGRSAVLDHGRARSQLHQPRHDTRGAAAHLPPDVRDGRAGQLPVAHPWLWFRTGRCIERRGGGQSGTGCDQGARLAGRHSISIERLMDGL
jgi:hypothetical protein